ncbi:MAG: hypothetical protein WC728_06900 [Elusimicrobiota bacterium]
MGKGRPDPDDELGPFGAAPFEEPLTEMEPSIIPQRPYAAMTAGGLLGGLLGATAGHVAVYGLLKAVPASSAWMRGAFGPSFFYGALSTALYYAFLGAGLMRGKRRFHGAALGLVVFFACFALPLAVCSRIEVYDQFARGIDYGWFSTVFGLLALSSGLTVWLLGAASEAGGPGFDATAGFGALAGAVLAYLAYGLLAQTFPALRAPLQPPGPLPPLARFVDGALSGAFTGLAAAFSAKLKAREPVWY